MLKAVTRCCCAVACRCLVEEFCEASRSGRAGPSGSAGKQTRLEAEVAELGRVVRAMEREQGGSAAVAVVADEGLEQARVELAAARRQLERQRNIPREPDLSDEEDEGGEGEEGAQGGGRADSCAGAWLALFCPCRAGRRRARRSAATIAVCA